MSSKSSVPLRQTYNSNIFKYYPSKGNSIFCVVCRYRYRKDAPLSTLQKHLRVKHGFSIRNPPTPAAMKQAILDAKRELGIPDSNNDYDSLENGCTALINPTNTSRISINTLLNPDSTSLEEAIVDWISTEGVPISSISSPGFRQIIQICNSNLVVPSESSLKMLVFNRNAPNHSRFPEPHFKSLPQYTLSPSEESYTGGSSNHPNDYSYEALLDSSRGLEGYQSL